MDVLTYRSVVKSYNSQKGFGFLARPAGCEGVVSEGKEDTKGGHSSHWFRRKCVQVPYVPETGSEGTLYTESRTTDA